MFLVFRFRVLGPFVGFGFFSFFFAPHQSTLETVRGTMIIHVSLFEEYGFFWMLRREWETYIQNFY